MNSDQKTRSRANRSWGVLLLLIFGLTGTALSQTPDAPEIVSQPASRTNNAGTTAGFTVQAGGAEPLGYQWCREGVPMADDGNISGALAPTLTLSKVFGADAGGYSVIITNVYGSATSQVTMLSVVDPVITTQPSSQSTSKGQAVVLSVTALGTPPLTFQWLKDGASVTEATKSSLNLTNVQGVDAGNYQVIVSNAFGSVTSAVAVLTVNLITLDTWNPIANGPVYAMAVQTDGKVLVGGQFTTLGGRKRTGLGRVAGDGTVDTAFNPGVSSSVYALAVQLDGKILVGGNFAVLGGQPRSCLGRLNGDGTVDASFNPGMNGIVNCLAVQADGKILVGGNFTALGGQPRSGLGRLNGDGTVDATFNPSASGSVCSLVVQPDGKILVGGNFTRLGGKSCSNLGRLNADGSFDTAFNSGANSTVNALAVQPDGKILVGGALTTLGGKPCSSLGRLTAEGMLDNTWGLGTSGTVYALAMQPDGKVLVGGGFTALGGQTRNFLGRLNNSESTVSELVREGETVTWLRDGNSSEVWYTYFEASTNGADWFSLGDGVRVGGAWQRAGVNLPADAYIRARGFVTGGYCSGSSWFLETLSGPPIIVLHPMPQWVGAGQTAVFQVAAVGTPPLSYQWRKDGNPLVGATAPSLTLTNVQALDTGSYDVVVSNPLGRWASAPARLAFVVPPATDPGIPEPATASRRWPCRRMARCW